MNIHYPSRIGQRDLEVVEVGTQHCAPGYRVGPAVRDFYLLHYIHDGEGLLETGGSTFALAENRLFTLYPHRVAMYGSDLKRPWHYSWIGFRGTLSDRLLQDAGFTPDRPIALRRQERLDASFRDLMSVSLLAKGSEAALTGMLYRILGELAAANAEQGGESAPNAETYAAKAAAFVETHYANKLTLNDIARHVGLDGKYLCRLFNRHIHTSPYSYLLSVRMNNACRLMERPELSISDISRSVGYPDPLQFSRMFKKMRGVSPVAYRKRLGTE